MTKTNEWEKRIDYLLKHQEDCVIFDEIKREVNYLLTQKDAEVAEALKAVRSAYENGKRDGKAELRKDLASLLHSELDQDNK